MLLFVSTPSDRPLFSYTQHTHAHTYTPSTDRECLYRAIAYTLRVSGIRAMYILYTLLEAFTCTIPLRIGADRINSFAIERKLELVDSLGDQAMAAAKEEK